MSTLKNSTGGKAKKAPDERVLKKNTPQGGTKKSTPQGGIAKNPGLLSRLPGLAIFQIVAMVGLEVTNSSFLSKFLRSG